MELTYTSSTRPLPEDHGDSAGQFYSVTQLARDLGVPFGLTFSCYDPGANGRPCGQCDACLLRRKGFEEAGIEDR